MTKYHIVGTSILLSTQVAICAEDQPSRPNILWLTYEDTSPQFIGCYGDTNARTPIIDGLASDGVRYCSAFSTGAVSSPSRFTLFTGLLTSAYGTGNHRSNYSIPEDIEGFAYYLRKAGYYTTNNSKTDYNIYDSERYIAKAWDESSKIADWRGRAEGQPFFAIYNSLSSHQSRTMTLPWSRYQELVLDKLAPSEQIAEDRGFEMPLFYRDNTTMQHHLSRVYNSLALTDKEFGEWIGRLEDDGLRDDTIILCFSDHGEGIPRGKASALAMGFRVPFVAWFPPKYAHLSPLGVGGVVSDELVSFEDIVATTLSIAGVEGHPKLEGRIFLGDDVDKEREWVFPTLDRTGESIELSRSISDGEYIYTRVFTSFQPFCRWNIYWDLAEIQLQMRKDLKDGVLNNTQSEILRPREMEYLFNIKEDKWEVANLVDEPSMQRRLHRMRKALKRHIIEVGDIHFIPEYSFQLSENRIPYDLGVDRSIYPLRDVVEVAWLSGGGAEVVEAQIKALASGNPFVQYWGAVGLFCQRELSQTSLREIEHSLESISYDPCRIYLLSTLSKFGRAEQYHAALKEYVVGSNLELARIALQTIVNLDDAVQRSFVPVATELYTKNHKAKDVATHDLICYCKILLHLYSNLELSY